MKNSSRVPDLTVTVDDTNERIDFDVKYYSWPGRLMVFKPSAKLTMTYPTKERVTYRVPMGTHLRLGRPPGRLPGAQQEATGTVTGRPNNAGGRRIISPPGHRLRAFAELLYTKKTFERYFEPIIADLRTEYIDDIQAGRNRRAQWRRVQYGWQFLVAMVLYRGLSFAKKILKAWKSV